MDDNRATADMLAAAIAWDKLQCAVVGVAYDGVSGRALIIQKKPDIVIADIRMPGMDGLQMVELTRRISPKTKVIYISAYDDFHYAKKALDLRAYHYMLKPFDNEKLIRVVQRIIEETEAPEGPAPAKIEGGSLITSRILDYIRDNPGEQLSLQALAQHFELTSSYISTLIKKNTGKNYLEWVVESRISLAKRLLRDPNYRIEEIASVVGYKNYISFYNIFVKNTGVSPRDYRNGSESGL